MIEVQNNTPESSFPTSHHAAGIGRALLTHQVCNFMTLLQETAEGTEANGQLRISPVIYSVLHAPYMNLPDLRPRYTNGRVTNEEADSKWQRIRELSAFLADRATLTPTVVVSRAMRSNYPDNKKASLKLGVYLDAVGYHNNGQLIAERNTFANFFGRVNARPDSLVMPLAALQIHITDAVTRRQAYRDFVRQFENKILTADRRPFTLGPLGPQSYTWASGDASVIPKQF